MSGPLTLVYLDIPGLAEPIRMALRYGGIEFVDRRVGYDEISQMREDLLLPYGQVPVLQLPDGTYHGQTGSLLRYAGRLSGLYPEEHQLRIDSILVVIDDLYKAFIPLWYKHSLGRNPLTGAFFGGTELTPAQQEAALSAVVEVVLPTRLRQIERDVLNRGEMELKQQQQQTEGGDFPFVCGKEISIADLAVLTLITGLEDGTLCESVQISIEDYPVLKQLVGSVRKAMEVEK